MTYAYITLKAAQSTVGFANSEEARKFSPVTKTYDATVHAVDIIDCIFIVTQVGNNLSGIGKIPWQIKKLPITAADVAAANDQNTASSWASTVATSIAIDYDINFPGLSSVPKNVGLYNYTINITNGQYIGFFTTDTNAQVPDNIIAASGAPDQDGFIFKANNDFLQDVGVNIPERFKNNYKQLIINPRQITVSLDSNSFTYSGFTVSPKVITNPLLLDFEPSSENSSRPSIQTLLQYSGTTAQLAAPINTGTYEMHVRSLDLNYTISGTDVFSIVVNAKTDTALSQEQQQALENTNLFISELSSSQNSLAYETLSKNDVQRDAAIQGVLSTIPRPDIPILAKAQTIAQCAEDFPKKLLMYVAARIAAKLLSYIPGLAVLNMINEVLAAIEQIKRIMALIEYIKDNPWAFIGAVVQANTPAAIAALKDNFPGIVNGFEDINGFVNGVADGVIDICNAVDSNGNLITTYIKSDSTKTPTAIVAFNPPVSRVPVNAIGQYNHFQYELRDALFKDGNKIKQMKDSGNLAGVQEYVSMLTAVHELAYNYHDRIFETGSPSGPIGILGGVTGVLSSVEGFLSGATGFSINSLKNEFNYNVNEMTKKHPYWSQDTLQEYNSRVNRIRSEMENNVDTIRNNPSKASASPAL